MRGNKTVADTVPTVRPLKEIRAGTAVRIKRLSAAPEINQRLREMGFCEAKKIKLLLHNANLICQIGNVRVGLGSDLAEHIWVEPVSPAKKQP